MRDVRLDSRSAVVPWPIRGDRSHVERRTKEPEALGARPGGVRLTRNVESRTRGARAITIRQPKWRDTLDTTETGCCVSS